MTFTLETIRDSRGAALYPRRVLDGAETALVLFAAAFHGRQDAIHVADAGLAATCVDLDGGRLAEMEAAYPDGWEYVTGDVFEFAAQAERQWDVVSIDCPSNLFDECAGLLPLWCRLARRAVVLGCGMGTDVLVPDGWRVTELLHRSSFRGGVYWAVVEPVA